MYFFQLSVVRCINFCLHLLLSVVCCPLYKFLSLCTSFSCLSIILFLSLCALQSFPYAQFEKASQKCWNLKKNVCFLFPFFPSHISHFSFSFDVPSFFPRFIAFLEKFWRSSPGGGELYTYTPGYLSSQLPECVSSCLSFLFSSLVGLSSSCVCHVLVISVLNPLKVLKHITFFKKYNNFFFSTMLRCLKKWIPEPYQIKGFILLTSLPSCS